MLLATLTLLACTTTPEDTGGDIGTPETVAVSGKVEVFGADSPLDGGEVCVEAQAGDLCGTTDAAGHFEIADVPANTTHGFTVSGEGYFPARSALIVGSEDLDLWGTVLPAVAVQAGANAVGVTLDDSMGQLLGFVLGQDELPDETPEPGFVATLSDSAAEGPFYAGEAGTIDDEATETNDSGLFIFLNVTPGTWDVTATKDGATCRPHAWLTVEGSAAGTYEAVVEAGMVTYVGVVCEE